MLYFCLSKVDLKKGNSLRKVGKYKGGVFCILTRSSGRFSEGMVLELLLEE